MIFSQSVSLLDLTKENQKDFNKRGLNCNIYLMDYESQSDETRYLFLVKCKEQYTNDPGVMTHFKMPGWAKGILSIPHKYPID